MSKRKKIKLNMKFNKNIVVCAKSPELCRDCKDNKECEEMEIFYFLFNKRDLVECFKNDQKRK